MSRPPLEKSPVLTHYITMKCIILTVASVFLWTAQIVCQTSLPMVTGIQAEPVQPNQITVSWNFPDFYTPAAGSVIYVYRTEHPVVQRQQIENSIPVAELSADASQYTDTVSTNTGYYYTVIIYPADGSRTAYNLVVPAVNSTVTATSVTAAPAPLPSQDQTLPAAEKQQPVPENTGIRIQPLPYLDITQPSAIQPQITEETAREALSLTTNNKQVQTVAPYIFRNEQSGSPGGDDFILAEIVQTYFIPGNYGETIRQLTEFLQLNRAEDITARGLFYLGESYYYTGNYREALTVFLQVQDSFPELAGGWIQTALNAFTVPITGRTDTTE